MEVIQERRAPPNIKRVAEPDLPDEQGDPLWSAERIRDALVLLQYPVHPAAGANLIDISNPIPDSVMNGVFTSAVR